MPFKKFRLPIILIAALLVSSLVFFVSKQFNFFSNKINVAKNFELVESSPEDGDNSFSSVGQPTFVFSKKIGASEADLNKFLSISPSTSGTWHKEKNGNVVYFSSDKTSFSELPSNLSYNTVYKISISKNFYSSDNQHLDKDLSVEFRTKQNPKFDIQSEKKLLIAEPNKEIAIIFNSTPNSTGDSGKYLVAGYPLKLTVQSATEDQMLQYFKYKKTGYSVYQGPPTSQTKEVNQILENYQNESYQVRLDSTYFPNPGLYFITFGNESGHDDLFVAVSNHINQVFNDQENSYVWVSDKSGKSLRGASVSLYSAIDNPTLLDKVTTAEDGTAKSQKSSDKIDFIISHVGNDIAVTSTHEYGNGRGGSSSSSGDNLHVFSYTDRPIFRPGDSVHYKAVIRKKVNGAYSLPEGKFYASLSLDYEKPDKTNYKELSIDQNGTVTLDLALPQVTQGAYPQITLSTKNSDGTYNQIDSLPVVVQSYRKPDMDITATSKEKEYISSDSAHFTVSAKTNYGQPLANVDFSYRVLVSDFTEVKDRSNENIEGAASPYYGSGSELSVGNGRFDNQGQANINFPTSLPSKFDLSQLSTLEVTPKIGASPSIGKVVKLIHRGEFALFIDDLVGNLEKGISGSVSVLNHNIPRQSVGNQPLVISLYKVLGYQSKQFIESQSATSNEKGLANFSFKKADIGSYEVVVSGADSRSNTVSSSKQVYIGQKDLYPAAQANYKIDLKSDKSSYKAGETANISALASFSVGDLVVIVTNTGSYPSNIQSITKYSINATSANIPILIDSKYREQMGVNIYSVSNGVVVSSHADLTVDKTKQEIDTNISFDKKIYKPGETVTATITTKDQLGNPISGDNSLSIIDASILQIGQLNGDIFSTFYSSYSYSYVSHHDSTTGIYTQLSGGGGGCFLEGTKILMDNGTLKNIEDVKLGDKILTKASDNSSHLVEDTVVKTFRHAVTDYLTINDKLNVTWIHRIFLNNQWQEAKDAKVGDSLLDEEGNFVKITSIVTHIGQFKVYNLETKTLHTFFAEGFYVHNEKGVGPRENFADTAYWNPHIQTDSKGKASVSFKLPDNVTTFTAQVFSNTRDSNFGQGLGNFISQKDFNIIPAVPNFYYQGDKPVVSAIIQNSSPKDAEITLSLLIKEIGFNKNMTLNIPKDGFATATFPIDLGLTSNDLSFLIEAKDGSGKTLDSLQLKRVVLPKGNIKSSWQSFQGSKDLSFKATYPTLDFNNVNLWVVPNIVSKIFNHDFYMYYEPSSEFGKQLYSYSYILAATRDGVIAPTAYHYGKLKNDFLDKVSSLLRARKVDHWVLPKYQTTDTLASINLWITQALDQSLKIHMLDGVNNLSSIIATTKQYVIQNLPAQYASDDEALIRQWALNQKPTDPTLQSKPAFLAVSALNGGDLTTLDKLRKSALSSANDRYIWDGTIHESASLPVIAMIEKGTSEDGDRAIKGLSYSANDYPLELLAAVKYAQKRNLFVSPPSIKVLVNNQSMYVSDQTQQYSTFTRSFPMKNTSDGKIVVHIETKGEVPIYTTLVSVDYQIPTEGKGDSFQNIKDIFNLNKSSALLLDLNLKRVYKDISSGVSIPEIKVGESGIVELSLDNKFKEYTSIQNRNSKLYSFLLQDALSPSFIFLNQYAGNSPQYQSTLNKIYPSTEQYVTSYTDTTDYSDEAVFFDSSIPSTGTNIVLPYVVYNVSGGSYYQPKTSIVFPILGIISAEH